MVNDAFLERVRRDPLEHLSCRSLDALIGYKAGYVEGCLRWHKPLPSFPVADELLKWLLSQVELSEEHSGRLNALNWLNLAPLAHLRAVDDREAFDLYFELRREISCLPLNPPALGPQSQESLMEILRRIQQRPGMYFSNDFRILHVWAFCSGFRWAERDAAIIDSLAEPLFSGFPQWLELRYPFSRGIPWHRLFHTLSLGSATGAFKLLLEHLEMFFSGAPADTEDPTMKQIRENIIAHISNEKRSQ